MNILGGYILHKKIRRGHRRVEKAEMQVLSFLPAQLRAQIERGTSLPHLVRFEGDGSLQRTKRSEEGSNTQPFISEKLLHL